MELNESFVAQLLSFLNVNKIQPKTNSIKDAISSRFNIKKKDINVKSIGCFKHITVTTVNENVNLFVRKMSGSKYYGNSGMGIEQTIC